MSEALGTVTSSATVKGHGIGIVESYRPTQLSVVYFETSTGKIRRISTALNASEAITFLGEDESLLFTSDLSVAPWTHYVELDEGELVAYNAEQIAALQTPAPKGFIWDVPNGQWVDHSEVEQAITDRTRQLKLKRDAVINATFTWDGSVFDSDSVSQMRILGLYTSAVNTPLVFPINWRLNDNSWRSLSAEDATGLWTGLQTHIQTAFVLYGIHEVAIQALATRADVLAYDIDSGWPT